MRVVVFSAEGVDYSDFLKLNYKLPIPMAEGYRNRRTLNDIILQKAILP